MRSGAGFLFLRSWFGFVILGDSERFSAVGGESGPFMPILVAFSCLLNEQTRHAYSIGICLRNL